MSITIRSWRFQLFPTIGGYHINKTCFTQCSGFKFTAKGGYSVKKTMLLCETVEPDSNVCCLYFRNYILNYLATRPTLQGFVSQALILLLAKITKYGW